MARDAKFWQGHVAEIERDGWVVSEYAQQHGLSVTALYYWRAKLKAIPASASTAVAKFMTLNVMPAMPAAPCVVSVGAVRVETQGLPAPEWLAALAVATQGAR